MKRTMHDDLQVLSLGSTFIDLLNCISQRMGGFNVGNTEKVRARVPQAYGAQIHLDLHFDDLSMDILKGLVSDAK